MVLGTAFSFGWAGWLRTRTWVPLYTPVSLSRGHIRTQEFKINLESTYWIYIEVQPKSDNKEIRCLLGSRDEECNSTPSVLKVRWSLSDAGKSVAQSSNDIDQGRFGWCRTICRELGSFFSAGSDHYVLDMDVLEDGSRLNAANPYLRIEERSGLNGLFSEYGHWTGVVLWISIFLVAVGFNLWLYQIKPSTVSPSAEAAVVSSKSKFPFQIGIGTFLVLAGLGVFIGVHHWMVTRTFNPVDMPISLARGHIKTGPFKINLRDNYRVEIDTGQSWLVDPMCPSYGRVKAQWVLHKDEQVVANWKESTPYTYLGGFDSEKGTYDLDLEILSDTGCLDPGHPRLLIHTGRSDYEVNVGAALWGSAFCAALGAIFLVLGCIALSEVHRLRTLHLTDSETVGQHFQWAQKLPLRKQFSAPPAFALIAGTSLFVLIVVFMTISPLTPRGLYVYLLKPGPLVAKNDVSVEPIVVQVVDAGRGVAPNLYVNSKPTSWGDLGNALKNELKIRSEWVVYVESDDNIPWADAVTVVDIAKGLHAKVVLMTSKPDPRLPRPPKREMKKLH